MTIAPVPLLMLSAASDAEQRLIDRMAYQLGIYEAQNTIKLAYYEGTQTVEQLGIAIPPNLSNVSTVVGWAGTTVDVLEERLDWFGWASESDDYGLGDIYAANELDVESSRAHLDALIYGTGFAVIGSGADGEPSPLVTMHSPMGMTGIYNARTRRLEAALAVTRGLTDADPGTLALYLADQTVYFERNAVNNQLVLVDRDEHNLGRVPVVQFENRARNDVVGRSEITAAVRSYTDQAVRTMLAMEIHREFYQAPQRYVMGVGPEAFESADGTVRTGWETIMGRVWALPKDDDGDVPTVGQFTPASPTPYLEQVKGLAQLLAAEAGIPATYLGFQTENPASADAIRAAEARLIKRAERRQTTFGRSWLEVARLSLLVRDGEIPVDFTSIAPKWRDAATPTRAASADEAVKLVGAGILPADSSVTYDRLGLSPAEQRQIASDRRRASGSATLTEIRQAAAERAAQSGATTQ